MSLCTCSYSNDDQENLSQEIENWRADSNIQFRKGDGDQKLLFVHQNKDQKRLLELYGNDMVFLDATYKTTSYALPLFFLSVQTNTDHQVLS